MPRHNQLTYLAIGLVTGLLSGLMGVGGGVIMVPLMVNLLPMTQHQAQGTSLAIVLLIAGVSAVMYGRSGETDLLLGVELAIGGVFGARLGALLAQRIPGPQLRRIFGVFILAVGLRLILPLPASTGWLPDLGPATILLNVAIGFIIGILSGLLGVGGGVILVPTLVLLLGTEQHLAQGVSLIYVIPTALAGAYTHYRKGNVVGAVVPWVAAAAAVTAIAGSSLALVLPAESLKQVFGLFLIAVGTQMILSRPRKLPTAGTRSA